MDSNPTRRFAHLLRVLLLTAVWLIPLTGKAQESLPVRVTEKQMTRFSDALQALAKQAKVAIVAEGTPYREELPVPQPWSETAPFSRMVKTVAEHFDYEVIPSNNGRVTHRDVILLRKRYSHPGDLPSVTFGEYKKAAQEASKIVGAYVSEYWSKPDIASRNVLHRTLKTLKKEQIVALRSKTGVSVSTLTPEQRHAVFQMGTYIYIDYAYPYVLSVADLLGQENTIRFKQGGEGQRFGFTYRLLQGGTAFQSLERATYRDTEETTSQPGTWGNKKQQKPETIEGFVKRLNARQKDFSVTVEEELREKTLTVAGEQNADPVGLIRGVASVYGLRAKSSPSEWRILRQSVLSPRQLAEVSVALRTALPEPLLRAIHDGPDSAKMSESTRNLTQKAKQLLAESLLPDLKTDANLALKTRPAEEKALFALANFQPLLNSLRAQFSLPPPLFAQDLNSVHLSGGLYKNREGKTKVELFLGRWDAETEQMETGIGIGESEPPAEFLDLAN